MKNKIVKFGSVNHAHGIMWNVVFEKNIPGTNDLRGFSLFREFVDGPEWLKSDVTVMGLNAEIHLLQSWDFVVEQTRDQEALDICRLIANGVIQIQDLCEKGRIHGDMATMLIMPQE